MINLGGNTNNNTGGLQLGGSPQNQGLQLGGQVPAPQPTAPATGGIQLSKGQKLDLTKGNPGLDNLLVGLGWDVNNGGADVDLDAEVFLLNASGKVPTSGHVVFYNNLISPDGSVRHNGDNRTGAGDGDDETIHIGLSKVGSDVEKIVFAVSIDEALKKRQNFGQVSNAYIRIINESNGQELCRFDLTEDHSASISMIVGEVYRHNGEWKFGAVEQGSNQDLGGLCSQFGAM